MAGIKSLSAADNACARDAAAGAKSVLRLRTLGGGRYDVYWACAPLCNTIRVGPWRVCVCVCAWCCQLWPGLTNYFVPASGKGCPRSTPDESIAVTVRALARAAVAIIDNHMGDKSNIDDALEDGVSRRFAYGNRETDSKHRTRTRSS